MAAVLVARLAVVIRRVLVALVALVAADVAAARLVVWRWPDIDVPPAKLERRAREEQEKVERQYRIESALYDHDLAKQFDGVAGWGPLHYRITTDSLGFKDASTRVVPIKTTTPRVLLLGDSFTEGIGLPYAETYAGLIAAALARQNVDVLNAAVTSYSPAIYFAKTRYLIEDLGLQVSDLVVFIDISDAEDEARYYDLHADGHVSRMVSQQPGHGPDIETDVTSGDTVPVPTTLVSDGHVPRQIETPSRPQEPRNPDIDETPGSPAAPLKRFSVIARALDMLYTSRHTRVTDDANYPQASPRRPLWTIDERDYEAFGRTGLELGSRHMDQLLALTHRHGIALTIAVYPWPEQVRYDTADSIQVRYWRQWASRRGVGFVDLFEPFFHDADRASTIRRFYIPGDVHFNADGAKLVASAFLAHWRPVQHGSSS